MKNTERKVAVYVRSRKSNKQEGSFNSIDDQKKIISDYANINNLSDSITFTDDEIHKAPNNRPMLTKMMEQYNKGNVDYIIVKSFFRLGFKFLIKNPSMVIRGRIKKRDVKWKN